MFFTCFYPSQVINDKRFQQMHGLSLEKGKDYSVFSTRLQTLHMAAFINSSFSNSAYACIKAVDIVWNLVELTGQDGAPFALFLHVAVLLARKRKGCLEDEVIKVVIPFKVRLLFQLLLLIKVRHHIRDLNVGKPRIQVFGVYLDPDKHDV